MNILVVGSGRVGAELAHRLFQKGHKVTVIDHDETAFRNLPLDFRGRTVEGDALNIDVLRRAGIESMEGIATVTSSDSLNAILAHLARTEFEIPIVVARNYDPSYRAIYDVFNLQVISSSSWGAQRLEEMLYHSDLRTVFSAGNGEVEIYEFSVPKPWSGKDLGSLLTTDTTDQCVPVSLTRAGRALLPTCETVLMEDDTVLVSATLDGIRGLRQRLHSQKDRKEG